MSYTDSRPLDPLRWLGGPTLLCLALTVVFATPVRLFGLQLPEPVFPLAPAFAWAVIRPSVIAPLVVLAMGLFLDFLWYSPIGLWGVSLLVGYGGILACRSMMMGQARIVLFAWYVIMVLLAMSTGYLITVLDNGSAPSVIAGFWQLLPTVLLFPASMWLIDRFEDADVRFR